MPEISVIVPIYNVETYLENCITSILNQTFTNIEIILINDGSTDSSGIICDYLAKKDSRIKVIHKENAGVSEARNTGLKNALGNYISFVDSDDYIHPQMLEILFTAIKKFSTDISMVYAKMTHNVNDIFPYIDLDEIKYKTIQQSELLKNILGRGEDGYQYAIVCNKLYNKHLIRNTYFNSNIKYGEDTEYCSRCYLSSKNAIVIEEELYHYYLRVNSTIHQGINLNFIKRIEMYHTIYGNIPNAYRDLKAFAIEKIIKTILNIKYHTSKSHKDLKKEAYKIIKPIQDEIYPKFLKNKHIELYRKLSLSIFLFCPLLYKLFMHLCEYKAALKKRT